eukprot:4204641-Pleurochrysis_carterae.AAC.1
MNAGALARHHLPAQRLSALVDQLRHGRRERGGGLRVALERLSRALGELPREHLSPRFKPHG